MKNYCKKHFPMPSRILLQFMALIFFSIVVDPLLFLLSGTVRVIAISICGVLTIAYIVFVIITLTVGSNCQLVFNCDGIAKKTKGRVETYRWSHISSITVTRKIRIKYGYLFTIMRLDYANGGTISFEISQSVLEDIRRCCNDSRFLDLMDESLNVLENN